MLAHERQPVSALAGLRFGLAGDFFFVAEGLAAVFFAFTFAAGLAGAFAFGGTFFFFLPLPLGRPPSLPFSRAIS